MLGVFMVFLIASYKSSACPLLKCQAGNTEGSEAEHTPQACF